MTTLLKEHWYYITPDNIKYLLTAGDSRVVLTDEGTGMPEIDYISQRGAFQHGETLVDYFLLPRIISMQIRHKYCRRNDYWNGRAALLNALRPNRVAPITPGKLQKILSTGTKRNIDVVIQRGPLFNPRNLAGWEEFSYAEELRFIAHNPVWYDPTALTVTYYFTGSQLVFPLTFPILFGANTGGGTINYAGSWEEYPTIDIYGPVQSPAILNITTGKTLLLSYNIPIGFAARFLLTYGNKSIFLNDGTDLIGYAAYSDLAQFSLQPGNNVIQIQGSGVDAINSKVIFTYYNRYIGI